MRLRDLAPVLLPGAVVAALLCALLTWGARGHRDADRATARADSLATEAAAGQLREHGYQVTLTGITRDLTRRLDDSVAVVLEAARARPIIRAEIEATASGSSEARRDSVASGRDSTIYRISDPVLSGTVTVWADSASARVDWTAEFFFEVLHAAAADGRLLSAVQAPSPRITVALREVAWRPPEMQRSGFRWGCMLTAGGTGAATAATEDWRVFAGGSLLTFWRCRR